METNLDTLVRSTSDSDAETPLDLHQIQGNIIGFLKDHQYFLFLRFPDGRTRAVEQWLGDITPGISTGAQVLEFNKEYKARKDAPGGLDGLRAIWLNLAFTYLGLKALSASGLGNAMCNLIGHGDELGEGEGWEVL